MWVSQRLSSLAHIQHGFLSNEFNIGEKTLEEQESFNRIQSNFKGDELICLRQKHSSVCHIIDQVPTARLTGDALITRKPNFILCTRTADCVPILIAHKNQPIIAAVHAGWKGAILEKIIENTAIFLKEYDSLSNYVVAIGPCLHQENFEVGATIYNNVACKKYFSSNNRFFNFPLFVKDKLLAIGFGDVDDVNVDTYAHKKSLFSFRRSTHTKENNMGRQASVILIKPVHPEL